MNVDYLIIANLMSGKGESEKKLQEVKRMVSNHEESYKTIEIREPKRISKIILADTRINKNVICIGGDGTVSETVGLMINNKIDVPLRILPTGTANIIAGTLGIEGKILEVFRGSGGSEGINNIRTFDIGVAQYRDEKEYFLLGIGLGFEEKFIELAKKGLKTRFGSLSYILTALSELFAISPFQVKLEVDNKIIKINVALLVAFNLQPKILKAFPLFPFREIKGDDGLLNVFYVEYRNRLQAILGTLLFHIFGNISFGLVKKIKTSEISIESPIPCRTQIDGEIRGELPVRLSLSTIKLRVAKGN